MTTVGEVSVPVFLKTHWLLSLFAKHKSEAHRKYKKFISKGKGQLSPWEFLKNQVYLGSEHFVERHIYIVEDEQDLSEVQ